MVKFLIRANYLSGAGVQGLLNDGGTKRRAVVDKLAASVGGNVESYYYAFGDTDLFVIMNVPDNISAAALSLKVGASGLTKVTCVPLLTAEEIDEAAKMSINYSAPGE